MAIHHLVHGFIAVVAALPEQARKLEELRSLAPQTFAPRIPPKDSSLPKLRWHATNKLAPASAPDGRTFDIVIINRREAPVLLFWMDRRGKPKPYGAVEAGWRISRNTRPGAVWMITDSNEKPLGYFVVGDRAALAAIPEEK